MPIRILALTVLLAVGCGGDAGEGPEAPDDAERPAGEEVGGMHVTSPAFGEGDTVPLEYTCDGENVSPPLQWTGVPDGAASLSLSVDDPDAPGGTFVHWLVTGIDPAVSGVGRGEVPRGGTEEGTSFGRAGYGGPCPPEGDDPHRYRFTIQALSADGEPLARGVLTATYGR